MQKRGYHRRWIETETDTYALALAPPKDFVHVLVYFSDNQWRGLLRRRSDKAIWRMDGFKSKPAAKAAMLRHYFNAFLWKWPSDRLFDQAPL